jgi:hypothetical protein
VKYREVFSEKTQKKSANSEKKRDAAEWQRLNDNFQGGNQANCLK